MDQRNHDHNKTNFQIAGLFSRVWLNQQFLMLFVTIMGPTLAFSKLVEVPANRVWRLITDTRTWPLWGPSVRGVDCKDRYIQAASSGRIRTPVGVWVPFVVGAFEPESYWDWRVAGVQATGHRVESVGPNRCRLTFTVPAWAFGYGLICRLALMRIDRLLMQAGNQHGS